MPFMTTVLVKACKESDVPLWASTCLWLCSLMNSVVFVMQCDSRCDDAQLGLSKAMLIRFLTFGLH